MGQDPSELKCRSCGAPLSPADLSSKLSVARCAHCGVLTGVKGVKDWSRETVALPRGFHLEQDGTAFVIVYDGGGVQVLGLAFLAVFGIATLFFLFGLRWQVVRGFSASEVVGLCAALTLGMALAVMDATGFLRRRRIRVGRETISVAGGPLGMEKSLKARGIAQFFTRESRGQENALRYEVFARWDDGSTESLVGGLPLAEQALYIEQRIERALRIEDKPVPGEIPRSGNP